MKGKSNNFPYPVLCAGSSDYVEASFNIQQITPIKAEGFEIYVNIEYDLECSGLEKLIMEGKAEVYSYIFCAETSYRRTSKFSDKILNMSLSKKELSGKVTIGTYIIALDDINEFTCEELNKDFWSGGADINKGDKLAIGDEIAFSLDSYDPLRPVKSIFQFQKAPDNKVSFFLDWNGNKIIVYFNQELWNKYLEVARANELKSYIPALIIIPALIETFIYMKQNCGEDYIKEKNWYKSIDRQLRLKKIDLQTTDRSLFDIANDMLHNGVLTALNCVERAFAAYKEQEDKK